MLRCASGTTSNLNRLRFWRAIWTGMVKHLNRLNPMFYSVFMMFLIVSSVVRAGDSCDQSFLSWCFLFAQDATLESQRIMDQNYILLEEPLADGSWPMNAMNDSNARTLDVWLKMDNFRLHQVPICVLKLQRTLERRHFIDLTIISSSLIISHHLSSSLIISHHLSSHSLYLGTLCPLFVLENLWCWGSPESTRASPPLRGAAGSRCAFA